MGTRPKHLKKSDRFPNLAKRSNVVTSDRDPRYNCIAFAYGRFDKKIWPSFHIDHYWPSGVPRGDDLTSLINLYASIGYDQCADGILNRASKRSLSTPYEITQLMPLAK